jgi:DNA primase
LRANQPKLGNSRSTIKVIKEQHNIVEVISTYSKLAKSGKSQFYGKCPFHNDMNPSLGVSQEKQVFHCLSCHKKGDVVNFVMEIEHLDTKQA